MVSASGTADGTWQAGTLSFIGPSVQVTVATGQKVFVHGSAALGSTAGAQGLLLYICHQPAAGAIATDGVGLLELTSPNDTPDQRQTYGLSAVLSPAAGTYNVGLCGQANASWNSNGNAYNSAEVATVP
jgi:hypothetical protein